MRLALGEVAVSLPDAIAVGDGEYQVGQVRIEVRHHEGVRGSLDIVLWNVGDEPAEVAGPLVSWERRTVAWLGGATGLVMTPGGAWWMLSGWCGEDDGAARLFGERVWLPQGGRVWSRWRRYADLPQPAWLPARRYAPVGEPVEVLDLDVALSGESLSFATESDRTFVTGPVGLHRLVVHGPSGNSFVEVGWRHGPGELVAAALDAPARPDVEAWLLTWKLALDLSDAELDRLDLLLGESLQNPTLFGVLAGLRAAATLDKAYGPDAATAARNFLAAGGQDAAFVAAEAVLDGHGDLAGGSPSGGIVGDVAARLEFGLPSSAPPGYSARDVAVARLWLAARPDSPAHLEAGRVVETASGRLACRASAAPEPLEVAWLLVGYGLSSRVA